MRAPRDGQNVANVERLLHADILTGALPAGSVTSQAALSERYGIGRTPLREALRLLQREGLIVSAPNRRVRITELSAVDAEELYVIRIALETLAVALTVPAYRPLDLATLEGYLAQMEHYIDARDRGGLREPHRAFHLHLVSATGDRGVAAIAALFDHAERYRLVYGAESDGDWDARSAEHRAIVDAASSGDAQVTALRLAEHYAHTAQLIFNGLEPGYGADRLRAALALAAPGSDAALDRVSVAERAQARQ
jgi:DNA-binding GntR family transcriptional regulator